MKKAIAIILIAVMALTCFSACGNDKSFPLEEGHMLMLGQIRFFSEEELNDHYVGWTRDEMIYTWGAPHSSYYGFYGDAWYHDYENGKMICARYNPEDDKVVSIKLVDGNKKNNDEKPVLETGGKLLLEQVKYFSEEELNEYFADLEISDLIEMWGAPPSGCPDLDISLCYGNTPRPLGLAVSYADNVPYHQWCYDYEEELIINVGINLNEDSEHTVKGISFATGEMQIP